MERKFLESLGLDKDTIDKVLDQHSTEIGKQKQTLDALTAERDGLKTQLSEAGKTIEGFKAMDIDGIKRSAEEYKQKAEQAERDAAAKIADMEFNGLLSAAITGAKGKNAKAVMALLDMDTLKASKNQSEDIKTALDALKKDSDYLFESDQTPPPYAAGTGTPPPSGGKYPPEVAAIRAAAGLKNE